MKYLSIVVLVAFQASVCCAEDFDLTKLGKAKPLKAQVEPTAQVAQETKPEVTGVGDGNNQPKSVVVKKATVTPTRYWGVVGYQRVGIFGRRPVYGWLSTSGTVVRSTTVRSTTVRSCTTGRCSGGG